MSKLLFINSSPRGSSSVSFTVGKALVERLTAKSGATVVTRDLAAQPAPHIDEAFVTAIMLPPDQRTAAQNAAISLSDALANELLSADAVVIAAAMINFGIPSTLKSWVDHISRAGLTFRYGANGRPEGLVTGKKLYLVEARGGIYSDGPFKPMDFQHPYLAGALGFLGMTDIATVLIEGLAMGPDNAQMAVQSAMAMIEAIA